MRESYLFVLDGVVEVLMEAGLDKFVGFEPLEHLNDKLDPDSASLATSFVVLIARTNAS